MRVLKRLPLFLLMMGGVCAAMALPAVYALALDDLNDARAFFYSGLLGLIATSLIAIARASRPSRPDYLRQLAALLAAYVALPAVMAVPFYEAVRTTTFLSAYFEMVSAFSTTGATLFDPARLSGPEHLWRAQVGWMGGLVIWVAAAAIMAPLTIGGFEVTASGEPGQAMGGASSADTVREPVTRLWRVIGALVPVYAGLTAALCIMLLVAGDPPLVALSHAMGVMSTSGISPLGGLETSGAGRAGEMLLFLFLIFGLSRMTFSGDTAQARGTSLRADPEFRLGLIVAAAVAAILFLRHWVAAVEVGDAANLLAAIRTAWGALFTALSFLVTAGYVSADWAAAQGWSGLGTPGIVLMGLAILGGGVATTAGGVKLLRVYALYLNGAREIERLVLPSSVGRASLVSRRIRREGGFIAWVFFMLFALMLAALAVALGLAGVTFEAAMVLSVAVLTNTGPLIAIAPAEEIALIGYAPGIKLLLCAGMVLGRLELLAIIVMLNPDIWRD